jgi:hypothetical protein
LTSSVLTFQTKRDHAPSPRRFGLTIQRDGDAPISVGEPLWISGVLALEPGVHTPDRHEQWMRSLFVSVVSLTNQRPYCSNLIKDQLLFGDEATQCLLSGGQPAILSCFRFELLAALQRPLPAETYFVELSARQHRSNLLIQEVG